MAKPFKGGSSTHLRYQEDDTGGTLVYLAELDAFDDGPAKPVRIWSRVGRRPILAGGNSNGDIPMLHYTGAEAGPPPSAAARRPRARVRLHGRRRAVARAGGSGRLDGGQRQEGLAHRVRRLGRMSTPDGTEQEADVGHRGVHVVTDVPRQMVRIAYRDPEHICERLTLQAVHRLAEPSLEWAQEARAAHPDGDLREVVDGLGTQTARIARLQGMVAGTPFYLALVPGYMNYLWQEARMNLRLAALYGRDPGILQTAAELLSLRGVYPTTREAEAGLLAVEDAGVPPKPETSSAVEAVDRVRPTLLVFGGFIGPPSGGLHSGWRARLRDVLGVAAFLVLWAITWIFPVTFMIMMAWGCESHSRQLFQARVRSTPARRHRRPAHPSRGEGGERACRAEGRRSARPVSRSRSRFRPASSRTRFTSTRSSGSPGCRPLACSSPSPS